MKEQGAHQCAAGLDVLEGQAVVEKHSGPLLGSNTEPEGQDSGESGVVHAAFTGSSVHSESVSEHGTQYFTLKALLGLNLSQPCLLPSSGSKNNFKA